MTSSKHDAGATGSEYRATTRKIGPYKTYQEVMGVIWEEEIVKNRRKREFVAFLAGGVLGACVSVFLLMFMFELTGGCL